MNILVTGGAGYIGSHTVVELLGAGHDAVVVDNLANSKEQAVERVRELSGRDVPFHNVDLRDAEGLRAVFQKYRIDAVIHFAGWKAVGESTEKPLEYYDNNLVSTLNLCRAMVERDVWRLVFSSTCTVYGEPEKLPVTEQSPTGATTNPYARSKFIIEQMLRDIAAADPRWRIALLRYFNPVGAHKSGLIGEDPVGIPNNLLPFISQVAAGKLSQLRVFGGDYGTRDGTCIRDYIHVVDLGIGHVAALKRLEQTAGICAYNLGLGRGYSVLEVIDAFQRATNVKIPYEMVGRRPGDVPEMYGDCSLAKRELGWEATRGIEEMCADSWNWQSKNPAGYR